MSLARLVGPLLDSRIYDPSIVADEVASAQRGGSSTVMLLAEQGGLRLTLLDPDIGTAERCLRELLNRVTERVLERLLAP